MDRMRCANTSRHTYQRGKGSLLNLISKPQKRIRFCKLRPSAHSVAKYSHRLTKRLALHPSDEDDNANEEETEDDSPLAGVNIALRALVPWRRRVKDLTVNTWNIMVLVSCVGQVDGFRKEPCGGCF